jgi:membrane-associated protein
VFGHFTDLVANASGWAYAILFVLAFLDALVPIVPSETSVITAGVVASAGDLSLPLVILFAASGAFAGDNTSYFVGARYGTRINDRFFQSEKAKGRIAWAQRQVQERGGELIVIARFIPGGRTAVTFSAGYIPTFPWRRFVVYDAVAAAIWATYAAGLGYFGGKTFENHPFLGLLIALGVALSLGLLVEVVRHRRQRRAA